MTTAYSNGSTLSYSYSSKSSFAKKKWRPCCSLSMNGCGYGVNGGSDKAVGICQAQTLQAVSAPESAVSELKLALAALNANPPRSESGIIRLEVPIRQRANALDWLNEQQNLQRCYFSKRGQNTDLNALSGIESSNHSTNTENLVSAAGVGSAVSFKGSDSFALQDWRCIKRFLSRDNPLIRAYGGIRFDANANVSPEWKNFGSFYFTIPQVEFDELEESSMLATNIAWDNTFHWTWETAMRELQNTIHQISSYFNTSRKTVPRAAIVGSSYVPNETSWDSIVNKALELINMKNSDVVKLVLARRINIVTDTDIDPVTLLSSMRSEGQYAYGFYIQPPDAPAFIGNTPEQLFHRKLLHVSSEALAGTRARGLSKDEDFQIGQDLLSSPKDDAEFAIVRESIRRKMKTICSDVIVEPSKALRKLPRIQHLISQISGRLRSEDDEFDLLTSLHPSPAMCGFPREETLQFIKENELFDRGMFAGPVGYFGGSESEFGVGIRSALVGKGSSTFVYTGTGIVDGADANAEWEEMNLKASQFMKFLQHPDRHYNLK